MRLNSQDVSPSLQPAPAGHALLGIVSGPHIGNNELEVFKGSGTKHVAEVSLRDYQVNSTAVQIASV